MKKQSFFAAIPVILIAFLFGFQSSLNAQKTVSWKGGAPGRPTDWNYAPNWKEGRVPGTFSDVQIFNSGYAPRITRVVDGVNSVTLMPGATLHIEKSGVLQVYEKIELLGIGGIRNSGQLKLPESEATAHNNLAPAM